MLVGGPVEELGEHVHVWDNLVNEGLGVVGHLMSRVQKGLRFRCVSRISKRERMSRDERTSRMPWS